MRCNRSLLSLAFWLPFNSWNCVTNTSSKFRSCGKQSSIDTYGKLGCILFVFRPEFTSIPFCFFVKLSTDSPPSMCSLCFSMQPCCTSFVMVRVGQYWRMLNGLPAATIGGQTCCTSIIFWKLLNRYETLWNLDIACSQFEILKLLCLIFCSVCNMLGIWQRTFSWSFLAPSSNWWHGNSANTRSIFLQPFLAYHFSYQRLSRIKIDSKEYLWPHQSKIHANILPNTLSHLTQTKRKWINKWNGISDSPKWFRCRKTRYAHWYDEQYQKAYIPFYTNMSSFSFGMIAGLLYCKHKQGHIDLTKSRVGFKPFDKYMNIWFHSVSVAQSKQPQSLFTSAKNEL